MEGTGEGEARRPPRTDIRRHPIRLSLGELVSTRARFCLAGRRIGYTLGGLAASQGLVLAKEPAALAG